MKLLEINTGVIDSYIYTKSCSNNHIKLFYKIEGAECLSLILYYQGQRNLILIYSVIFLFIQLVGLKYLN